MAVPYFRLRLDEGTIERTVAVLRSSWITTGPAVREFEQKFAEYIGGGVEAISVNSCTAGLHLSLEAMGVGPGDEVITTDLTFTATAEVIRYMDATPIVVDCDLTTLCIDINQVKASITDRTKAIIVVHYAGFAIDLTELSAVAKAKGIWIVEDAAHALPSLVNGLPVGRTGADATCFSFYANKTMTTGEGGMVVTNNIRLIERIKVMRLHGINRDAFNRFTEKKAPWEYDVIAPGFKYNMTDVAAATGIGQLAQSDTFSEKRRGIAIRYDTALKALPIILPPRAHISEHSWHLYVIQIDPTCGKTREALVDHFMDNDIGFSVHYKPLHRLQYWRDSLNLKIENYPNSETFFNRCLSLPIFPDMSDEEVDEVIGVVKRFFEA
ncbi:hypothetical protein LCGC14_0325100 [marine sediment metagenome]|uniref:Uncharacterized protein n=1 Tax=marine sediment metagenome TaxID=412755 RepID=A0A0F9W5B3_9ZZZZ